MVQRHSTRTPQLLLVAWTVGLVATLGALTVIGSGRPGSPPVSEPGIWADWLNQRAPLDAAAGVARLLAIALVVYLLVVTLAQLAAGLLALNAGRATAGARRPLVLHWLGRMGPPFLISLTASAALAAPGVASANSSSGASTPSVGPNAGATMVMLADDGTTPTTSTIASTTSAPTTTTSIAPTTMMSATSTIRPDSEAGTAASSRDEQPPFRDGTQPHTSLPWAEPPTARNGEPVLPSEVPAPARGTVVVRPGDHLWGIAETEMSIRLGHPARPAEIDPYWRSLIAANRDRLVDPDNSDLIFPGQQFVLPDL